MDHISKILVKLHSPDKEEEALEGGGGKWCESRVEGKGEDAEKEEALRGAEGVSKVRERLPKDSSHDSPPSYI